MSFDYLSDIWGRFRKNKVTRFSNLEAKATGLIKSFVDGTIDNKSFDEQFNEVRLEYIKLTNVNGESVIDQDTPLWLSSFLGFKYVKWHKVQQVKRDFEDALAHHPERITDDIHEVQNKIKRLEKVFLDVCKSILRELEK